MKNNFPMHWTDICPTDEGHRELYEKLSKYKFTDYKYKQIKYNQMMHDAIDSAVDIIKDDLIKRGLSFRPLTKNPASIWGEPSSRYTKKQIIERKKQFKPIPEELEWTFSIPEIEKKYSNKGLEKLLIGRIGISFEQMPNIWSPNGWIMEKIYGYPENTGGGRILLQGRGREEMYKIIMIGMSCGWSQIEGIPKKVSNKLREEFPRIAEEKNLYFGPFGTIADNTYIDGIQSLLTIPEDLEKFSLNPLLNGILKLGDIALSEYLKK